VGLARKLDVVDVPRTAGQEASVLDAPYRLTDAEGIHGVSDFFPDLEAAAERVACRSS